MNGATLGEDGSKVTPLGTLVSAVARGGSAALEFARLFLARGDVDLRAAETLGDGARRLSSRAREPSARGGSGVGDEAEAPPSRSLSPGTPTTPLERARLVLADLEGSAPLAELVRLMELRALADTSAQYKWRDAPKADAGVKTEAAREEPAVEL